MNLPNQLTTGRLVLTILFLAACSVEALPHRWTIALIIFIVASITDYLDGAIARNYNLVTDFGKLMDPLADKVLVAAAFVVLVAEGLVPAWIVVVILAREFLVTGLRLVAAAAQIVVAADRWGKLKTILQITTIIYFLVALASEEAAFAWISPMFEVTLLAPTVLGAFLVWATMLLTAGSGVGYVRKNSGLLSDM